MEFDKKTVSCLKQLVYQTQSSEETQEVKINDSMPDIDRVLGAWGQVLLRSKEWRQGEICITGGIMGWVMYMPEGDGEVQCVECWMPFQCKYDFTDDGREGNIQVCCTLESMDARSTSARKLMVRGSVAITCEATAPMEEDVYYPGDVPPDVQLLQSAYLLTTAAEAGEKQFLLDEDLTLPQSSPKIQKLLRYELHPELAELRIVANKIVFRGNACCHILYYGDSGELHSQDFEIPFSQYGELNADYSEDADAAMIFAVTNLELETEGEILRLKAGITGQYTLYDQIPVTLTQDAYSLEKDIKIETETLNLPVLLDSVPLTVQSAAEAQLPIRHLVDAAYLQKGTHIRKNTDSVSVDIPCGFQILYYNTEGKLEGKFLKTEAKVETATDKQCTVTAFVNYTDRPVGLVSGDKLEISCGGVADMRFFAEDGLCMIKAISLSERSEQGEKPSLILKKAGCQSLWDIAKSCSSSVAAIKEMNQLTGEPDRNQMLIIPIF